MENKNINKNGPIRDTPFTKRQLSRADVVDIIIDLQAYTGITVQEDCFIPKTPHGKSKSRRPTLEK